MLWFDGHIGFFRRECMKYIIYGAGMYGAEAVTYFGEENILCFADGALGKIGSVYCNKRVISFNQMVEKAKTESAQIILALEDFSAIKSRLKEIGLTDFAIFNPYNRLLARTDECPKFLLYYANEFSESFIRYGKHSGDYETVGILDPSVRSENHIIEGLTVTSPESLSDFKCDYIGVCADIASQRESATNFLTGECGISPNIIIYKPDLFQMCRIDWMARYLPTQLGCMSGKNVLDLCCGDGRILEYLAKIEGVKYASGIDMKEPVQRDGVEIIRASSDNLPYPNSTFDFAYSQSTFEHIQNHAGTLAEVKRVLKPGGLFYAQFTTPWSSCMGHHCMATMTPNWKNIQECIPAWGHLYMNETELTDYIRKHTNSDACLRYILNFVFYSDFCNKIPYFKIRDAIVNSDLLIKMLSEDICDRRPFIPESAESELTWEVFEQIPKSCYRNRNDLLINGAKILLWKPIL
jgi:ubiquinone/menaquinone biosynthesis C-methylase UbiE